jgi:DNA end-binding protein Ku
MAPRPNWKGYLKLSLVSCPVALYPATSPTERVSFNQINRQTGNRIRYKKVDAETQEEVERDDIVRGYEVEKNVYLQVEDEELEALEIEATHTIDIERFVPRDQLDLSYYDSPYYIVPNDKIGQDAFAVIRDAMRGKDMVAVGSVVMSKRERPIILEPYLNGMRGMTLRYPYEVRKPEDYFADIPDVKVSGEMLKLAEHIIENKTADFEPEAMVDRYEVAVVEMLKKKQAGVAVRKDKPRAPAPQQSANVIDLLKRSLELSKSGTKKVKSPPLQPTAPKAKSRARKSA